MGEGLFAGVVWAAEEHAVCVVDREGGSCMVGAIDMTSWGSGRCVNGCCGSRLRWWLSSGPTGF